MKGTERGCEGRDSNAFGEGVRRSLCAWMSRFTAPACSNLTWTREQSKALRSKKPAHKTISNMCLFDTPVIL